MPVQPSRTPSSSPVGEPSPPAVHLVSELSAAAESGWARAGYALLNVGQAVFLCVWSVFWISLALVLTVLTLNRNVPLAMARRFWAPGLIWASGSKLVVEPHPDLDWSKPHIFAMNHQSMFDIPCAFAAIPVNIRFVAKHVLQFVPFLGWYMWMTGMIFVNRSDRAQAVKSLSRAGEQIRAGANILAYPEGTRSKDGQILPLKKGALIVALEAKVPIVPVAIEGSRRALPSGGFRMRPATVRLKLGAPIETSHRTHADREALSSELHAALVKLHRELGG